MSNIPLNLVLIPPTTRAGLPNPTLTVVDALISVTDENNAILQNNGTAWIPYSPTGNVGITTLTGDVSAGPGSGEQASRLLIRESTPSNVNGTWWCEVSGVSPAMSITIYARILNVTVPIASVTL